MLLELLIHQIKWIEHTHTHTHTHTQEKEKSYYRLETWCLEMILRESVTPNRRLKSEGDRRGKMAWSGQLYKSWNTAFENLDF